MKLEPQGSYTLKNDFDDDYSDSMFPPNFPSFKTL